MQDEVLIAGFGRRGHAVGDIPGVRFKARTCALIFLLQQCGFTFVYAARGCRIQLACSSPMRRACCWLYGSHRLRPSAPVARLCQPHTK